MNDGVIVVNKEKGISSQKVVSKIKKKLKIKAGHTGTLDLEASGILPVVIGKATRISDYIMNQGKTYVAEIEFGKKTDTLDYSGKVISTSDKVIDQNDFLQALKNYIGEIYQVPPMYSALKRNGKKLYELAREGVEVNRNPRKVTIYDIKLLDFKFPFAKIEVSCSKGTYIRSLVDDLGEELSTFAYLKNLVRTKVGKFKLENSIDSSDIETLTENYLLSKIISIDESLIGFKKINFSNIYLKKLINGVKINIEYESGEYKIYCNNIFIGIGEICNNILSMKKVFYEQ
ncbi:MAG: tRNA pseudouridine(55) synthase TruB [Peptoniphilaceae bacterium]|nr:tRNA pseudouridine(55) synthase TruB [Peptoniphilaceae bacterium]MDD7382998.1 tRNA pseudouridine(55) synthase TruB [Peptoniphilaceae bacterium]MDY3737749.1 tRNA pseudouridine(55) synthase TruB [Peptoniphilaceae bacterium]